MIKSEFYLFYFAIHCWLNICCCQQTDCGYLVFSSSAQQNTSLNCKLHFQCESTASNKNCYKVISYSEEESLGNATKMTNCTDDEPMSNRTECEKEFSSSVYVWCYVPQSGAERLNESKRLNVLDHLEKVQNMHKNDADCIVWTPPHTDIKLQYSIEFMYCNGAIINSTTSNLTEHCLSNKTFDTCELVSVSVVAKAVCGDASSNITWWNGTVLKPSQKKFNISLAMVENSVTIDISYTINKTCPSVRALSANLSCYYEIMRHNETYQLTVNQPRYLIAHLVLHNNESVVLFPNEKVECKMILCNEAGQTEQWIEMFSTFPIQEFNISEVNKTHICMKYQFLNGSTFIADCEVTLNDTNKIELNGSKSEECSNHSLSSGLYYYCVSCGSDYCIMEGAINISNGGNTSSHRGKKEIVITSVFGGASVVMILILVIVVIIIAKQHKQLNTHNFNEPSGERSSGEELRRITTVPQQPDELYTSTEYYAEQSQSAPTLAIDINTSQLNKLTTEEGENEDAQETGSKNRNEWKEPQEEQTYKRDYSSMTGVNPDENQDSTSCSTSILPDHMAEKKPFFPN